MSRSPHRNVDELAAALAPTDRTDAAALREHMDHCAALAVRLGLTAGTVLAIQGSVIDRFGADLVRADQELVRSILGLLGTA